MRLTRSSMLEVLRHDYIRTARAKGVSQQSVLLHHALKNALIPVITVLGLQIIGLMGGSVIIESIFNLQGVGSFFINSITFRDYPTVQGMVLFFAITAMVVNLVIDTSYAFLDPRIRLS
jgi:peptide/nickel transport system permease protein